MNQDHQNNENKNPFEKEGPFGKDHLEQKPLSEKHFIQEKPNPKALSILLWIFLATALIAILWGGLGGVRYLVKQEVGSRPFLEVTNREMSVFLWQFSSFLRSHVKHKGDYLPGFQYVNKETMDLAKTEDFVVAPPGLLFLYHTWHRLLAPDFVARPISPEEFLEFLNQVEEWKPEYWKEAPKEYIALVKSLSSSSYRIQNLQRLPENILPLIVRQAFQGWKNYFKEGTFINQVEPTFAQLQSFLKEHSTYARNYWRNIQEIEGQKVGGHNYLYSLLMEIPNPHEKVPSNQLTPFLKVAFFNVEQAKKGF